MELEELYLVVDKYKKVNIKMVFQSDLEEYFILKKNIILVNSKTINNMEKASMFINLVKLKTGSGKMINLFNNKFDQLKKTKTKFNNK